MLCIVPIYGGKNIISIIGECTVQSRCLHKAFKTNPMKQASHCEKQSCVFALEHVFAVENPTNLAYSKVVVQA